MDESMTVCLTHPVEVVGKYLFGALTLYRRLSGALVVQRVDTERPPRTGAAAIVRYKVSREPAARGSRKRCR